MSDRASSSGNPASVDPRPRAERDGKSVTLVGLGNIGSHLVGHLARMHGLGVTTVTLVDRDVYEEKNLAGQDITPDEVGRSKAEAQAERLRRLCPGLPSGRGVEVRAIHEAVENVPLGLLRADVILAALDSRAARRCVNEAAWRLGVPWIDSGVQTSMLLARVNAYLPGNDAPCYECPWSDRDREIVDQAYPCPGGAGDGSRAEAPSTDGISSLGALAASMQALEAVKLLRGDLDHVAFGRRVTVDAVNHRHYVTRFARNPDCAFDHAVWDVARSGLSPARATVAQALSLGNGAAGKGAGDSGLRVRGRTFVCELVCAACGRRRDLLRLEGRLGAGHDSCERCGGRMVAFGFDALDEITPSAVGEAVLDRPLEDVGLAAGDVVCVRHGREEALYELGG